MGMLEMNDRKSKSSKWFDDKVAQMFCHLR